ncbi:type II secretion system protein [Methylophaga sp. UBA2689]|jgi:prepilin-type N-terminal cleavage/methylation domain-containing protein|uniref:type II secretion system protein n=1 Tax=Methylophaga sp. UBA2689 TaxID=1946878 RepID=UPI0025DA6BCF|nr:prepilin-type N-terminal cleavage/methylation domain-containing protein [Methylophaga sp. UBA2689]|tara:strand:- start:13364 stop:14485 length:1122 start_codon:yes stop_codon:yes gene_type:complete
MNIKQMKSMVSRFRNADFSGVQDPFMRAKAQKLQAKQKGFTLLELLVVITLLAILATGALVAYDGAGEKAQSSKAANTTAILDQGVRAYKAVTQAYPNQWDNLANPKTAGQPMVGIGENSPVPLNLQEILGSLNLATAASDVGGDFNNLEEYFEEKFGMDEVQHVFGTGVGLNGSVEPNRLHNEGTNPPDGTNGAIETEYGDFGGGAADEPDYISILASQAEARNGDPMACSVGVAGNLINATWDDGTGSGTAGVANPLVINSINDALSTQRCNLVLALGFGGDAAQSTVDSAAGVIQAPTYSSALVNPAESYARYVGLFLLASGEKADTSADFGDGTSVLVEENFLPRPRLLGFIDTEGNTIDANIAAATQD